MATKIKGEAIKDGSVPLNALTIEANEKIAKMINVTYDELVTLRNLKKLESGMQYRITDYVTTCFSNIATSARHPFDIIVTALDSSHLSEEAKAIQRDGDEYFANSNLAAWKIWYCLDNDQTRFSWIKNAPYRIKISNGVDEAECYYLGPTDWFSNSYIIDKTVQSNICKADDWVILSLDATRSVRNGQEEESGQYEIIEESDWSKGVIYRMIDEYNNDLPYDFKNIIFKNKINERNDFFIAMSFYHNLITTYYTYTFFNKETYMDFSVATDMSCTKNVLNVKIYPTIISKKYEIVPTTIDVIGCCYLTLHNNVHFVPNTALDINYVEIEGDNILNTQDITDHRFYNKRIAPRYNKLIVDGTEEFKYLGINIA